MKRIALRLPIIASSAEKHWSPPSWTPSSASAHRRNRLLKTFGNLDQIAEATDDQLRDAGLDAKTVEALRKELPSGPM